MARSHGKILASCFNDADWRALTPRSQWLYWLLLGQPKLSLVGCLDYMPARWAATADGCTAAYVEDTVAMLEARDYVVVDRAAGELLVRTFTRHDGIANANVNIRKGCWGAWSAMASPVLRKVAVDNMPDELFDIPGYEVPPEALQMLASPPSERASERALQQASEPPSEQASELTYIPSPSPEPASAGRPNEPSVDFNRPDNPRIPTDHVALARTQLDELRKRKTGT